MASVHAVLPAFAPSPPFRQVVVIGLGNPLLADDGVGVHAVQRLAADPHAPYGLDTLDGGTLGLRLLDTGLIELLTLAQLDGWDPWRLALLAIQPQRIDWDDQLSEPVVRALPAACYTAVATVLEWRATA